MLGGKGLTNSSILALLNANYIANRLKDHYTIRYSNKHGRVAHELLIDMAEFEKSAGLKVADFAKRLQVSLNFGLSLARTNAQSTTLNPGLRIPSTNLFLAYTHCYVDRANRI